MAGCISEPRSKSGRFSGRKNPDLADKGRSGTCPTVFRVSVGIACAALCLGADGSKVTAVRFWSLGDVTRVAIEVSSDFRYKSERLANPERLFFDIAGARPQMVSKGMHVIAVGDALVKNIRIAETQPGTTRVVLDLEQRLEFTASQLSGPNRLMIELRAKDRPAPPPTASVSGVKALAGQPVAAVEPDLIANAVPASKPEPKKFEPSPVAVSKPEPKKFEPPSVTVSKPEPKKFEPPAVTVSKPEPKKFEPPPVRVDPIEANPELLNPPSFAMAAKTAKAPSPAPSVTTAIDHVALPPYTPLPPLPAAEAIAIPARPEIRTEPLPAKRNANGDRSLTRALGLKLGRVVLDPGHGGHDAGTHGPSGLYEKDVVLDIAQRLGALLEARLASEVIYTRTDDTYIPLEQRTQIANDRKADLFLSIHANSSPFRAVAGVETYYLNFTASRAALDVAARENASSERSVFDLKELLQKIALKDKIDESREFASRVESSLYGLSSKSNPTAKNRGVKKAPFVVLIGASMPSVLAEIGFLTNSGDEALLRKTEHRQKIAEALYKGIASYADTLSHFQVAKRD